MTVIWSKNLGCVSYTSQVIPNSLAHLQVFRMVRHVRVPGPGCNTMIPP